MKRRDFLQGAALGGGMLGLGALGLNSRGRASPANTPKFVFVIEGNCVEPVTMLSPTARDALDGTLGAPIEARRNWYRSYRHDEVLQIQTPDLAEALALAPLGPLASQASVVYGLSCKISGGGHSAYHGPFSCKRTVAGNPGGITIDALLANGGIDPEEMPDAELMGEQLPFPAVRLGVGNRPINTQTCALASGRPAPIFQRPTTAYQVVLGGITNDPAFAARTEMLEFAREDAINAITGFSGPAGERAKLEAYRESLTAILDQQARLSGIVADPAVLPPAPSEDPRYLASATPLDQLALQFEIGTAALRSCLTNVVVIASGSGDEFGWMRYPGLIAPGMSEGRHQLHHESEADPAAREVIHQASRVHVDYIAQMARALAETPDGDGNMLDNTIIVYVGDNGETHHASASEFPVMLLGGRNLGAPQGRTLVYPGLESTEHRRLANLWMSLVSLLGVERNEFGGDDFSRVPDGPLPGFAI